MFFQGIKKYFSQHTKKIERITAHIIAQASPHCVEGFPQSPLKSLVYSVTYKVFLEVSVVQIGQKFSVLSDKYSAQLAKPALQQRLFLSKAPVPSTD